MGRKVEGPHERQHQLVKHLLLQEVQLKDGCYYRYEAESSVCPLLGHAATRTVV